MLSWLFLHKGMTRASFYEMCEISRVALFPPITWFFSRFIPESEEHKVE